MLSPAAKNNPKNTARRLWFRLRQRILCERDQLGPVAHQAEGGLTLKNNRGTLFFLRSWEGQMVRALVQEALALASLSLFLAMVAVWVQVLGVI